ncbi:MAG: DUF4365 domain-containing protein [Cyclobacteriaceae bacterium]|nr:DUF4365 domain-containing protein [Cyclobacteriaceae bacterium]
MSKRELSKLIEPHIINWSHRDYGLDGLVTLATNNSTKGSSELDSLHFLIQLKSTEKVRKDTYTLSLPIASTNIKHWVRSNLPVLFIIYDVVNSIFYHRWIDSDFIVELEKNKSNWINQKTVSIKFKENNVLTKDALRQFKEYLLSGKNKNVAVLPGQYFSLHEKVKSQVNDFKQITTPRQFDSSIYKAKELSKKIDHAIYRIAIAGPSRSGKSTLINSLLKKDISPVGIYQTTGVPIQILPGTKNQIDIYLKNGISIQKDFSPELILEYAAQHENSNNFKNVNFVSVSVINSTLEKGISFFDVPGLDDPDDDIMINTLSYVKTFNAIIYVIDVTPHKTGGFAFKNEFKRNLLDMSSSLDKVFLVFNKIDSLSKEELNSLKQRITYDLRRLNLLEKVDEKVLYLSAHTSFLNRVAGKKENLDSVKELEQNLWGYLLKENKSGIYRLLDITRQVYKSYNEFADILNTRLLDSSKLDSLHSAVAEIQQRLPDLGKSLSTKQKSTKEKIKLLLQSHKHQLILRLESALKAIPANKPLLSDKEIKKYLTDEINSIVDTINKATVDEVNQYKNDLDTWIEQNLSKVREVINSDSTPRALNLSPIETMIIPEIDLTSAFGMGILGGILAYAINPYTVVAGAVVGFLGLLLFTSETRRARKIAKIVEQSRSKCDSVFEDLEVKFEEGIDEMMLKILNAGIKMIELYFSDINNQIKEIKTTRLSENDRQVYRGCFEQLKSKKIELDDLVTELSLYK